jgi:glycosyltransferase involved in cell wall biosynthesis
MALSSVLLVCTNADLAGAPLYVRELARALRARGFEVNAAFGEEGPVAESLRAQGVDCHLIPDMRSDMRFWRDARSIVAMRRLVRDLGPSVVHAHSAKAGMVARLACRPLGTPLVYTVHGWGFGPGRPMARGAVLWAIELLLTRYTDHYVVVSNFDGRLATHRLGIRAETLTVVHNGLPDCVERARPASSRVVAMVARDAFPKDYPTLFRAAAGLDAEVWCIGRGTDAPGFVESARAVLGGRVDRIRFLGERTDVAALLSRAGVFVLSSRFEGLPLSVLEAMRAGLPVLASDVGGIPELVATDVNGYLFPPGSALELEGLLRRLLDDPALRERLGNAGRQSFERHFALDATVEATIRTYGLAIARSRSASTANREPASRS